MPEILFRALDVNFAALPGYPGYAAGEDGRILSQWTPRRPELSDRWRPLSPGVNSCGYLQVALYVKGKRFYRHVARLILLAFVGPCPAGCEVRHLNGRRYDNRVTNLKWGTKSENARDRVFHAKQKAKAREEALAFLRTGGNLCVSK